MILDTNALSALADGDEDLLPLIENEDELALPAVALGEFLFGVRHSSKRSHYERWLSRTLPLLRILAVGEATAAHYAAIRAELKTAGRPIPSNHIWIAALGREHHQAVVTRDQHFECVRALNVVRW